MYSTPFRVAWETCELFNTPRSRCPLCAATVSSTADKSYYLKSSHQTHAFNFSNAILMHRY